MLERLIRKIKQSLEVRPKRVSLLLENAVDDPPPGITSAKLAEIATLLLRGQNSPLRAVMAPGPEDDWEKMRKGITARPGTTMESGMENAPGLTVSIRVEKPLTREEAAALGKSTMDIVPRAIADASGMHRDRGKNGETGETREERT